MSNKKGVIYVPGSEGFSCPPRAADKQTVEAEAWDGVMADVRYCPVSAGQREAQATPGMGREVFKSFNPNISKSYCL